MMRRKYSHDRLISLSAQKMPSNHNIFTNTNLSSHVSPILPSPSIQQEKTVENIANIPKLQAIYTIINIHFPHYFSNVSISPSSITFHNYEQVLNNFCRYVKADYCKSIQCIQDQIKCVEIELKIVKGDRKNAEEKIKILEKDVQEKQQKIKSKQFDRFNINEEIFQCKHKIEQLEKQVTKKNLEIDQIFENFQKFKEEAYNQISKYQKINKKLKAYTIKYEQKIENLEKKNKCFQQEHLKQVAYLRQLIEAKELVINKCLHYQPPINSDSQQSSKNKNMNKTLPTTFRCNFIPNDCIVNNSFSPTPVETPNCSSKRCRLEKARTHQQLLLQIRQLRENQSSLLDRIAERDQIIENLVSKQNSQIDE